MVLVMLLWPDSVIGTSPPRVWYIPVARTGECVVPYVPPCLFFLGWGSDWAWCLRVRGFLSLFFGFFSRVRFKGRWSTGYVDVCVGLGAFL